MTLSQVSSPAEIIKIKIIECPGFPYIAVKCPGEENVSFGVKVSL